MEKWSRRRFLEAGVVGSIAIGSIKSVGMSLGHEQAKAAVQPSAGALTRTDQGLLRVAMDEIIPTGDGMPSASQAGGLEYLDRLAGRDKKVAKELRESLRALEVLSQKRFEISFLSLSHDRRVESLMALEREESSDFKILRDCVYEAYYTRPSIWKLIGYEFHSTNDMGPRMKAFDESVLAEVRKKPKYYREV